MPSRPTAGAMLSLPDAARIHIAATRAGTARGTVQTAGPREDTAPTVLRASLQDTAPTERLLPADTVPTGVPPEATAPTVLRASLQATAPTGLPREDITRTAPRADTAPTVLRASLRDTVLTGHPLPGATVRTADSRASLRDTVLTGHPRREDITRTAPRADTVPTDPPKASLPEAIAPTVPREGPPTLPSAVSGLSTEIRPLSARISRVKTPAMPARVLLPIPATMPTTRRQA